jgi:DMATS type aromatic prenyltransferase
MTSLISQAQDRLAILANLLDGGPTIRDASVVLDALMEGWGDRSLLAPPFPSHIGDDHSPFEFSLAFASNRAPELRLLVEAQAEGDGASLADTRDAALRLNDSLAQRFNLPLDRFEAVRDLFLPSQPEGAFSLWHAVCMWKGRAPEFKLYLNPQCSGADNARAVVSSALNRLGLSACVEDLFARGGRRGEALDEVRYFSLDLSRAERARVKVYYRHHFVTRTEIERAFSYAPSHKSGDAAQFLGRMAPGIELFDQKPLGSCFSYVQGQTEPLAVTLHMPIAHYAANDQLAAERIAAELPSGTIQNSYVRMIQTFANRPLGNGAGLQSYASYRREVDGLRTTVYLSPEVYQPGMFGQVSEATHSMLGRRGANDNQALDKKHIA